MVVKNHQKKILEILYELIYKFRFTCKHFLILTTIFFCASAFFSLNHTTNNNEIDSNFDKKFGFRSNTSFQFDISIRRILYLFYLFYVAVELFGIPCYGCLSLIVSCFVFACNFHVANNLHAIISFHIFSCMNLPVRTCSLCRPQW